MTLHRDRAPSHNPTPLYAQGVVDGSLCRSADRQEAERMSKVDGCPVCVENYSLPRITREQEHGFVAYYVCEDCGHDWITSWKD